MQVGIDVGHAGTVIVNRQIDTDASIREACHVYTDPHHRRSRR
jgi:hypothetical protein